MSRGALDEGRYGSVAESEARWVAEGFNEMITQHNDKLVDREKYALGDEDENKRLTKFDSPLNNDSHEAFVVTDRQRPDVGSMANEGQNQLTGAYAFIYELLHKLVDGLELSDLLLDRGKAASDGGIISELAIGFRKPDGPLVVAHNEISASTPSLLEARTLSRTPSPYLEPLLLVKSPSVPLELSSLADSLPPQFEFFSIPKTPSVPLNMHSYADVSSDSTSEAASERASQETAYKASNSATSNSKTVREIDGIKRNEIADTTSQELFDNDRLGQGAAVVSQESVSSGTVADVVIEEAMYAGREGTIDRSSTYVIPSYHSSPQSSYGKFAIITFGIIIVLLAIITFRFVNCLVCLSHTR